MNLPVLPLAMGEDEHDSAGAPSASQQTKHTETHALIAELKKTLHDRRSTQLTLQTNLPSGRDYDQARGKVVGARMSILARGKALYEAAYVTTKRTPKTRVDFNKNNKEELDLIAEEEFLAVSRHKKIVDDEETRVAALARITASIETIENMILNAQMRTLPESPGPSQITHSKSTATKTNAKKSRRIESRESLLRDDLEDEEDPARAKTRQETEDEEVRQATQAGRLQGVHDEINKNFMEIVRRNQQDR